MYTQPFNSYVPLIVDISISFPHSAFLMLKKKNALHPSTAIFTRVHNAPSKYMQITNFEATARSPLNLVAARRTIDDETLRES